MKGYKTGRPRCSYTKMFKIVLFSFMENGYVSLRKKERSCKNVDLEYTYIAKKFRKRKNLK